MKIRDVMTRDVIRIDPEESVSVAARTLTHYNIGALPVCGGDGRLCGVVTDRDLVTRCMASGKSAETVKVREVMTGRVIAAGPDMRLEEAAQIMGKEQVRRLPVVENGKLCGMVSLGDIANRGEAEAQTAQTLAMITANLSRK